MSPPRSVVIVGGGIAGVSTAAALRSNGFEGELTLVDDGELPYDRPPLSKEYLAGRRSRDQLALHPPGWYDDQAVRLVNLSRAVALRPALGAVELQDGTTLRADRVVLATGGRAARPPVPGSRGERVHGLRTVEDADRIRGAVGAGTRVLVVGAGLIGAEVASTLARRGATVTLVDPLAAPLADAVGEDVARWLHAVHEERGVTTLQGAVGELEETAAGIRVALGPGLGDREVDQVVVGVGMVPETSLAEAAGLVTDRGIVVDADQVTSNPAVLAVGDPAQLRSRGRALPLVEHWESAQHDGARAAATILGTSPPQRMAPWFWTDRHGLHVEVVGSLAGADRVVVRGDVGAPPFAVFGLRGGRVAGAVAVDEPLAVRAARRLIDRGLTVDPDALADREVSLRGLLRG